MKIALVHDDFMQFGGAERLVFEMSRVWPSAPIYTACFDPRVLPPNFPQERLIPSFIQHLPFMRQLYRQLFFLHPLAFEQFNFNEYEVVISSTTRFAKSIVTQPQTRHICYCNTPSRFLWFAHRYLSNTKSFLLSPLLSYLRLHDCTAAARVDQFVANSRNVAYRIKKFYHRDSQVVYPFVDLSRFDNRIKIQDLNKYYLIVSRLGGHKRVDVAVQAFNRLGWPLKIIGDGPERNRLQVLAKPNIKFLGRLSDEKVVEYYFNCKAFVYPQEEDFGITALEAQAAGKPVVAYAAGGAMETVIDGKTGFFFAQQTPDALVNLLRKLESAGSIDKIKPQDCVDNAKKFSKEKFVKELKNLVES